ncbi:MAG TPA: cache domain-containing protein [bacterium]|nr:cache domain-containing protein [bacterium]
MRGLKFTGLWLAPVLAVFLCRAALAQPDPAQGPTEIVSPAAVEGLNGYGRSLMAVIAEFIGKTMDAEADLLTLLSETQDIESGQWQDIKPRLAAARALGAKGLLWFAQPDGTYYTVEKDRMPEGLKDRDYFPRLMAGEKVVASLVVSRSTGKKSIVIAMPVKNKGAIVGAVGASIFLEDLNKELSNSLTLPDGVYFYALSPDGTVVLHKSAGMIFAKARELGSPTLTQAIDEMFRKPSGETAYEFNGFSKRAFFMTIPRLGWKVVLGANLKKL